MKRLISLLLSLILLFTVFGGTAQSLADEAENTDSETEDVSFYVNYNQTESRKMLKYLNDFKASDETWITVKGKKKQLLKVYNEEGCNYTQEDIARPLVYNYKLEEEVMNYAAYYFIDYEYRGDYWSNSEYFDLELKHLFSNKKYREADKAFPSIKNGTIGVVDDDSVRYYLANPRYKSAAFCRIKVYHEYYWILGFSEKLPDEEAAKVTTAVDGKKKVTCTIDKSLITTKYEIVNFDSYNTTIKEGKSKALPKIEKTIYYGDLKKGTYDVDCIYSVNSNKGKISQNKFMAFNAGKAEVLVYEKDNLQKSVYCIIYSIEHNYKLVKHKKATTKKKGKKVYKCKHCGKKKTEILPKLPPTPKNFKAGSSKKGEWSMTWKKVKGVYNYEYQTKCQSDINANLLSKSKTKYKESGWKSGTVIYVRMRSTKKTNGKFSFSKWTKWKKVTIQ